ncbi:MAG: hypothetical protein HC936_17245 [Leptolyngbyaceae cyanobacterium SU_3_3]|nr:hypothetical protein [Leptolyngbyaceae cyanobacterium SU_3_3]
MSRSVSCSDTPVVGNQTDFPYPRRAASSIHSTSGDKRSGMTDSSTCTGVVSIAFLDGDLILKAIGL